MKLVNVTDGDYVHHVCQSGFEDAYQKYLRLFDCTEALLANQVPREPLAHLGRRVTLGLRELRAQQERTD
jgi:hypothetical protein